jgi:four helix bundle protein
VGVRHFTELRCWQLSSELKRRMYALCARSPFCRDRDFCQQVRRAAASGPRNIAEGFSRFNHREFLQFARIARGSVGETQDALIDARDRAYLDENEFVELWKLSQDVIGAITGLMRYLSESTDHSPWRNARKK